MIAITPAKHAEERRTEKSRRGSEWAELVGRAGEFSGEVGEASR